MLSADEKAAKSAAILRQLESLPELVSADRIMAFASLADEVCLTALWHRLVGGGKTLLFPMLVGEDGRMDAVQVRDIDADLKPGRFGIPQPREHVPFDPHEIDFIFVPALAYDNRGNRVGRGGGYYDRFLAGRAPQAFRCGVAFDCQVLKVIPVKEHDCHVDALATEKGIRRFERKPAP